MVVPQESQRQPSLLHQRAGPGCRCQQTAISGKEKTNLVDLVIALVLVGGWLTLEMVNMYSCQVWGVVDLYGMTVKVTIVDRDERDEQNLITR